MIIFAIINHDEVVQEIGTTKKYPALFTNRKDAETALKKLEGKDLKIQAYRTSKTIVV